MIIRYENLSMNTFALLCLLVVSTGLLSGLNVLPARVGVAGPVFAIGVGIVLRLGATDGSDTETLWLYLGLLAACASGVAWLLGRAVFTIVRLNR
jgi:hypothetical protein